MPPVTGATVKSAVRVDRTGPVALVEVANPPLNLITGAVIDELTNVFTTLERDRECRAVVLTSSVEGLFLTHLDVADVLARPITPRSVSRWQARAVLAALTVARRSERLRRGLGGGPLAGPILLLAVHDLLERIQRSPMVTVAALNGSAVGPGFDIALAFDLRLVADGPYVFGLPETTLGGIPGAGATQRLTRLVGPAKSFELLLEGATLTPAQAHQLGLVNRVEPADSLIDSAVSTATRLARRSPQTIAALKRAVYQSASRSLAAGLRGERAEFVALLSNRDVLNALTEFAAQCRPQQAISPWLDPGQLERWRDGRVVQFSE